MAIEDIESMKRDGLEPTPRDIVRLNALALKHERAKSRNALTSMWYLPRVAAISADKWFRQPTIGHEIWISRVSEWIDMLNYGTSIAVYAYALSRDWSELPPPEDRDAVSSAIKANLDSMGDFTEEQVAAALKYVQTGLTQDVGEYGEQPHDDTQPDPDEEDWGLCISLGVLNKAKAVLWGVTETEAKGMTREQLEDVIEKSYRFHDVPNDFTGKMELGEYYRTLDAIRGRLEKERQAQEAKANG